METAVKKEAKDVYSMVTNRIIELLESGTIPWRKPWSSSGMPQNLISKRSYGGINVLLLNSLNYEQNFFLTWNQIQKIGASVKKGERSNFAVFHSKIEKKDESDGQEKTDKKSFLRYYKLFNIEQCYNVPEKFVPKEGESDNHVLVDCEEVIACMPLCPDIMHSNDCEAFYSPSNDYIKIPYLSIFESPSAYYGTLFHELIHATGAKVRLGRETVYNNPRFGSELYSQEELIAEIGSCFLKNLTGVPNQDLENSSAYIDNWLTVLKKDKRFIVTASSKAQQAVSYICNSNHAEENGLE
ncbi:MAG: zincin-like metallopeptidase domain-containing protein [Leadbetterella sp.]|nr:zincin-like metallopeptidase domain-containing protein [Leadbetterella sp.]